MFYVIHNKIGQPLVCSLADRTTLRIKADGTETIKDTQITDYLKTLSSSGLIILTEVKDKVRTKKVTKNTTHNSVEKKEEE